MVSVVGAIGLLIGIQMLENGPIGANVPAALLGAVSQLPLTGVAAVAVLAATAANVAMGAAVLRMAVDRPFDSFGSLILGGLAAAVLIDTADADAARWRRPVHLADRRGAPRGRPRAGVAPLPLSAGTADAGLAGHRRPCVPAPRAGLGRGHRPPARVAGRSVHGRAVQPRGTRRARAHLRVVRDADHQPVPELRAVAHAASATSRCNRPSRWPRDSPPRSRSPPSHCRSPSSSSWPSTGWPTRSSAAARRTGHLSPSR